MDEHGLGVQTDHWIASSPGTRRLPGGGSTSADPQKMTKTQRGQSQAGTLGLNVNWTQVADTLALSESRLGRPWGHWAGQLIPWSPPRPL
jgi:hypothetical protein